MRTEIDKDFRIERHKEYIIIWPFRTYDDEEDKEEPSKIDQQIQNNFEFNLWKLEVPLCIYFILKWVEIIFNLMSK